MLPLLPVSQSRESIQAEAERRVNEAQNRNISPSTVWLVRLLTGASSAIAMTVPFVEYVYQEKDISQLAKGFTAAVNVVAPLLLAGVGGYLAQECANGGCNDNT